MELEERVGTAVRNLEKMPQGNDVTVNVGQLKNLLQDVWNFIDIMKFEFGEDITTA